MRHMIVALLLTTLVTAPAYAHGGQYKGPSDAGGPSQSGGGQSAPPTNPGGAAAPGPGAPASGGPATGAGTGGGSQRGKSKRSSKTGGGALELSVGYEIWEFWWENNKDQYLNLKNRLVKVTSQSGSSGHLTGRGRKSDARKSRRPSSQMIATEVIPALTQLLDSSDNRDILDSAVLALGRSARAESADAVVAAAVPLLGHRELSVQTSATLSLGVLGSSKGLPVLNDLLAGTSKGRQLMGGSDIPWLVQAFSALSLGLINDPSSVATLIDVIKNTPDSERDVKVCSIVALGLMDNTESEAAFSFLLEQLQNRKLDAIIKSYIPTSLAKLGLAENTKIESVPLLVREFKSRDTDNYVRQSLAIALGSMATLDQEDVIEVLTDYIEEGKDMQTRHFCFISLAQIGRSDSNEVANQAAHADLQDMLGQEISKPSAKSNRSWAALASALYAQKITSAQPALIDRISKAYEKEKDPSFKAAFALSLGLLNVSSEADQIYEDFVQSHDYDFKGYAAVALGFMNYTDAAENLRGICRNKTITPTFRLQVATGLGLMGDTQATHVLIETLQNAQTLGVSSAVAKALGLIGDQDAIAPLKGIAADSKVQVITRAFAAVALGIVSEEADLPWNARISADNNYRARVPAIDEVLDIL
jgi:HEAT repeat protein